MTLDRGVLEEALEEGLKREAIKQEAKVVRAIRPIIATNLKTGRVRYFLDAVAHRQPAEYVERVASTYLEFHAYLRQVQVEKCDEVWQPLYQKLQWWIYNYLVGINFAAGSQTQSLATEYATEAATALLTAYFPYDVTFDAWAFILARNVTCKQLKLLKKLSVTSHQALPFEEELLYFRRLRSEPERKVWELRCDLIDAIARLSSETRKQIILRYYFDNFSLSEIALELNQPINAIYQEHFRSRKELRKILGQDDYKDA
jgi:RNA polymerase sigma factor (sigma-70 family)